MNVPVLTAVTNASWEEALVEALGRSDFGVTVVRRCVDVADLLATASAGTARAVLVSSDLRRLDRETLARLAVQGVAVVGLVPRDDDAAERRLRQLGVLHVLPADSDPAQISTAVMDAVASAIDAPAAPGGPSDPLAALPDLPLEPPDADDDLDLPEGTGRLIAVWGPTGAPGRTTVAVTLAAELAALGHSTLLADADVYGGAVAQSLGLLDEAPGLAAAVRLANNGMLDVPALAQLARRAAPHLRVLTGITRAERWTELRPSALEVVLGLSRRLAAVTVVDCGFCLEQDEELAYDQSVARRNGATLAALAAADTVLAVGSGDPVGLQRLVRGLAELSEAVPGVRPAVVVNRLRGSVVPGDAEQEITSALQRYAGIEPVGFVPWDPKAADAALLAGRSLTEVAPDSPARIAVAALAARYVGKPVPSARRRNLLRRR
jgi:MinD-like ATPase involved in chromosome partitioning or flagellar assembly